MTFRLRRLVLLLLCTRLLLLGAICAHAATSAQSVINDDASVASGNLLHSNFFKWIPDGSYSRPIRPICRHEAVEKLLRETADIKQQTHQLKQWIKTCGDELLGPNYLSYANLAHYAAVQYEWTSNPMIQKSTFVLSDGRKVAALIGLKKDGVKRPLIVTRCGVFCNATDGTSTSPIFMHLFEESPFNVVMLGSSTGTEFAIDNGSFSISGIDEGAITWEVIQQLEKNQEIVAFSESVHLFGFSLGGLGTLYGSLFGSLSESQPPLPIQSTLTFCSVVDLEPQLNAAFSASARGLFYQVLTSKIFEQIFSFVPILGDYLKPGASWSKVDLYKTATEGSFQYFKKKYATQEFPYAPFKGEHLQTIEDSWRLNRYQDVAGLNRLPTLVVHAQDDYLVPPQLNFARLSEKEKDLPMLGSFLIPGGNHCAYDTALGWPTLSSLLRNYFVSHSVHPSTVSGSDMTLDLGPDLKDWDWPNHLTVGSDEKVVQYGFTLEEGEPFANLDIKIYNPALFQQEPSCGSSDPFLASADCYRTVSGLVPIDRFKTAGLFLPKSAAEAQRMTRWLNTRSRLLTTKGLNAIGTSEMPSLLSLPSRYEF